MSGQAQKSVFERSGSRALPQFMERAASQQTSRVDDGDTVGEELDFRKRVGSEEQSRFAATENFGLQEPAKLGSADGVQAARRLVQQENARPVKKSTRETCALHRSGRECAHLPVKGFFEIKLLRELLNAPAGGRARELIEAAEKAQILSTGEPRVKTHIAAGVIAELTSYRAGIANGIVSSDLGATFGGKNQRGEDPEQSGLAGAIRAEQRQRFPGPHFERNPTESKHGGLFERLQERAPAASRGRK